MTVNGSKEKVVVKVRPQGREHIGQGRRVRREESRGAEEERRLKDNGKERGKGPERKVR